MTGPFGRILKKLDDDEYIQADIQDEAQAIRNLRPAPSNEELIKRVKELLYEVGNFPVACEDLHDCAFNVKEAIADLTDKTKMELSREQKDAMNLVRNKLGEKVWEVLNKALSGEDKP